MLILKKKQQYLTKLVQLSSPNNSLSNHVNLLMQLAMFNSIDGDPVAENTALIWALAIKFGSQSFAGLASLTTDINHSVLVNSNRTLS
jgi:hypothetical protein